MDINKIFNLFDENNDLKDEDIQVINLYEQPLFWVGMFEKLIRNNGIFKKQLSSFLQEYDPEYSNEVMKETGDHLVFNRAWIFIKQINLEEELHQTAIKARAKHPYLSSALEKALEHFIMIEEYEKCAHLKKIQEFIKTNLEA